MESVSPGAMPTAVGRSNGIESSFALWKPLPPAATLGSSPEPTSVEPL